MNQVEKIERRIAVIDEEMYENNSRVRFLTERARVLHTEKMQLMATLQRLTA